MFLLERLIGNVIYISILLCFCLFIAKSDIKLKKILSFYLVILCIIAYFYKPYSTGDLFRIRSTIEWFGTMDFEYFYNELVRPSSIPLSRMLYWIFGKLSIGKFISSFSCFISYSVIFYIINDIKDKYSISRMTTALTLFFIMTSSIYISVIGGIRMMISMSLVLYCYYQEHIKKRRSIFYLLLYIGSTLIHEMSIILVVIRFLMMFIDKRVSIKKKILYLLICLLISAVILFRFHHILYNIIAIGQNYLFGETYSDKWEYLMGMLILINIITIYCSFYRNNLDKNYPEIHQVNKGGIMAAVLGITFISIFTLFYRFIGHFLPLVSLPAIMITLEKHRKKSISRISLATWFMIVSVAICFISCTRGSLSSLKFFELMVF